MPREIRDEKAFDSDFITPGKYVNSPSLRSSFELTLSRDPIHGLAIRADAVFLQQENHGGLELAGCRVVFSGRATQDHGAHSAVEGAAEL
jgi:hypothetical protein